MPEANDILVIGAGAKAAAIAVKCHVLNELGLGPIRALIVEASEPAAAWLGRHGFTSGSEPLSTSPSKDVGFPYRSCDVYGDIGSDIDRRTMAFSWQQHLISRRRYSHWVDAGSPPVAHREYGEYLAWVLARATRGVRLIDGRAMQISLSRSGAEWAVEVASATGLTQYRARALALTGPGAHRVIPHDSEVDERIFHCDERRADLEAIPDEECDIALAGGGESTIACVALLRSRKPNARLTVYTPALPMSRAESFLENRVYSSPEDVGWHSLALDVRRDFVTRTDRGVFAPHGVSALAGDSRCRFVTGRVMHVSRGRRDTGALRVEYRSRGVVAAELHDYLVNCTGFDILAQVKSLTSAATRAEIERQAGAFWTRSPEEIEMGWSLEVANISPLLHIPALAALCQGPGFANLSSLGLLADRLIAPILSRRGRASGWAARLGAPASNPILTRKELVEQCF